MRNNKSILSFLKTADELIAGVCLCAPIVLMSAAINFWRKLVLLIFEHQLRSHLYCIFIRRTIRVLPAQPYSWLMGDEGPSSWGKGEVTHLHCSWKTLSQHFCIKCVSLASEKVKTHAENWDKDSYPFGKRITVFTDVGKKSARSPPAAYRHICCCIICTLKENQTSAFLSGIQITSC